MAHDVGVQFDFLFNGHQAALAEIVGDPREVLLTAALEEPPLYFSV